MVSTPATGLGERVRIMVVRLGRGLPIDSKVRRPMTTIWPVVIFLNHLKSSGRCHGILLPAPMTRLSDMAAMALKGFTFLSPANARPQRRCGRFWRCRFCEGTLCDSRGPAAEPLLNPTDAWQAGTREA